MTRIILATRNAHKVGELAALLGPGFRCVSLDEFPGAPAVIEDAPTFAGNAAKKASTLANWLIKTSAAVFPKTFVLADDSGLEVDALEGAPGVHSARFAAMETPAGIPAGNSSDAANNERLLRLLKETPADSRTARFRCVLALVNLDAGNTSGAPLLFEGVCEGRITAKPGGSGGFGYDPLFVAEGQSRSFAELGDEVKNRISHRAQAMIKLRAWLTKAPA
ncbi:MAG: XTP/dITP diphosphohydrolase [Verrucomicrobiota bacterium]|jgi:XTP/dITP diphosphohydrolase